MEKKPMTAVSKGLILALALIVLSVLTQILVSDLNQMQKFSWITYIIIIGGIAWAGFSYAKDMNGNVTFGNVFSHGFKATAVMTVLTVLFTILSFTVIFPDLKDKMIEAARQQMISQGKLNDDQIEQALTMTRKFFMPFAIGGILLSYIILGAIGSLLGAAIAKKNPNPVFPDQLGN